MLADGLFYDSAGVYEEIAILRHGSMMPWILKRREGVKIQIEPLPLFSICCARKRTRRCALCWGIL